jgi:hypothetical protein
MSEKDTGREAEDEMYSMTIVGNVERCRTEAEILDSTGAIVAAVYEQSDRWHTDLLEGHLNQADIDLKPTVDIAIERLSHYVNRRGENPPENATRGAFSLWLLVKDDGSAMGVNMRGSTKG